MEEDVLGLGTADPITNNPFAGDAAEETSDTGYLVDDDEDEEIDLRDDADTDDLEEDGDGSDTEDTEKKTESEESTSDDTDAERIAKLLERYKNNPEALAKALVNANSLIGKHANELGKLKQGATPTPETSDSQTEEDAGEKIPTIGPNGFPTDEFGLEVIPTVYFSSGDFKGKIREHLESPDNLIAYLETSGLSGRQARLEAQRAFDENDIEDYVKSMASDYRDAYKSRYQAARQEAEQKSDAEFQVVAKGQRDEQVKRCEIERAAIADQLGLEKDQATKVTTAVHNLAVKLVGEDVQAGTLGAKKQFDPEIVKPYYAKALAQLVQAGEYKKLLSRSDMPVTQAVKAPKTSETTADDRGKQTRAEMSESDLGKEALAVYKGFKRVNKDLTVSDFVNRHGRTLDMKK